MIIIGSGFIFILEEGYEEVGWGSLFANEKNLND